jgi:hypothetical protein
VYLSAAEIMIPEYFAATPGAGEQNNINHVKKTTVPTSFYLNFAVCITRIPLPRTLKYTNLKVTSGWHK